MTFGPWITPDPASGAVLFQQGDPRDIDVDSFGGQVGISPQQFGDRFTNDGYGDGLDHTQPLWDILRGFDHVTSDPSISYSGSTFSVGPLDPWNVDVLATLNAGATYPTRFDYVGMWGAIAYNQTFEPTLPPGAIGIEIDGEPESLLVVTLGYSSPPPAYGMHAISDFAGAHGILGNFPLQTNTGHYPYDLLSAQSPPPSNTLILDNSHAYFHALPSSLLNSTPPDADAVVPPDGSQLTTYRMQDCTFSTVYTITYPRYRFLFADAPARQLWPRTDSVGPALGRIYPPPDTQQSGRRFGSSSPL